MIKKINKFLIVLFFLSGCGYSPIFSVDNSKFQFSKIEIEGDEKVNRILLKKLNVYKKKQNTDKIFILKINNETNRTIASKDTKGNLDKYNLEMKIIVEIEKIDGDKIVKNFVKNTSYNNLPNKFELSNYEKSIKENLARKISEEIIIFVQSI